MNTILADFDKVNADFKNALNAFTEQQLFLAPDTESWSAALVAEHIILSDSAMLKFINGETTVTERPPDEHVTMLHDAFLNFEVKMHSRKLIIPKGIFKTKNEVVSTFKNVYRGLKLAKESFDLNRTCMEIAVPEFKGSTRLELLYFTIVHTQRHLHQLEKINAGRVSG